LTHVVLTALITDEMHTSSHRSVETSGWSFLAGRIDMILRPYQVEAINFTLKALDEHGNTLVVAPTGSGKTIMMAETIDKLKTKTNFDCDGNKTVVIQHRLKLVEQNADKFKRVNGNRYSVGILTGTVREPDCDVVFATVQTLEKNLQMIGRVDHFIIDEAHHAAAESYWKCVKHLLELNPDMKVLGYTATAARADGKGIGDVFSNTAYQVEIDLLIELGYLVQPESYIIDIGVNDEINEVTIENGLSDVRRQELMSDIYEARLPDIVEKWAKHAFNRHSVFFCTTIFQAEALTSELNLQGHNAKVIHSRMKQDKIENILKSFDLGAFHVLVNVAILTEGYDCPPVDCISLIRGCSSQSTMTQMLGRGLRTIEPGDYPWSKKENCIMLDFGDSIRIHGTLRCDANLRKIRNQRHGDDPFAMHCQHCHKLIIVDAETIDCPECGENIMEDILAELERLNALAVAGRDGPGLGIEKIQLENFEMTPAKLTGYSPFAWVDLTATELQGLDHEVFMANGFDSHVTIIKRNDKCLAIGKRAGHGHAVIGRGREKVVFAQANNFMSNNETSTYAKKSATWMRRPMTNKQLKALEKMGWTRQGEMPGRYTASCLLTYIFNHREIKSLNKEVA